MAPGKMKALGSPDLYTIGWIAALHIERAAAAAMLDEEHAQPDGFSRNTNDKNSYTWGRIGDHNIVIASLKAGVHGLVSAGATASSLLSSLPSIRLGLLVGIGGGIPRPDGGYDIRLGDVIVSQPDGTTGGVCQYDFVKAKPGNRRERKGFLAPPPDVLLHAVANIQSAHERRDSEIPNILEEMQRQNPKMAKKTKQSPGYVHQGFSNDRLFQPSYNHIYSQHEGCQSCEVAQEVERDERESADPEIHYGIIASGNMLIKDSIARDRIVAEVGEECICFEMEAAGLMNEFPCLVIRGVCDYADSHKNDQWQRYASATAAAYAKELLAYVPEADVQETKRASEILQSVDQKLGMVQQVSQAVDAKVESIILSDRNQKLREWLAAPDPNTNANRARELRHEGTGTWLLESSAFQDWMSGTNRHLWLRGMAGCGKTVLSTTILDHLADTDDRTVLSFFFDFGDTRKQTKNSLLRSMALQLYQRGCSSVAAHLDDLFRAHQEGDLTPNTATLEGLVEKMLTAQQRVIIFIDALDESITRDGIISWIKRIHDDLSFVQMIYTSREETDFMDVFPSTIRKECCLSIEKGATDTDIASYVSARLQTQPEFTGKRLSGDVLDRIRIKVGNRANGMFRWAACQLDSLAKSSSLDELEQQLGSLPLDLPDTYRRMIDSIPHRYLERGMRLLQFLVFSRRPLTLEEGVEIIATEIQGERPCFKPGRRLFNHNDILRHCPSLLSLVSVERWSGTVQELHLAHLSVKEYLLAYVPIFNLMDASVAITKTLLTYLSDIQGHLQDLSANFPLATLAATNWTCFAVIAEASEDMLTTIVSFLQRKETFARWVGLGRIELVRSYFNHACVVGLKAVVKTIIDQGIMSEVQGGHYEEPLRAASSHGHLEIVRLLIAAGADVNAERGRSGNALQAACSKGHTEIAELLIENGACIDAEPGDYKYGIALQAACHGGYIDIVRLLIKNNACINIQNGRFGNALVAASNNGHIGVVDLLLSFQADINAGQAHVGTPLEVACKKGHLNLVRLLLEKGADLRIQSEFVGGPLVAACSNGNDRVDIVQLLLDHGVDIDVKGGRYGNPLQAAASTGNRRIVTLLLEKGADVNALGGRYGSALLATCYSGSPSTKAIKLLFDCGANFDAQGSRSGSLLLMACLVDNETTFHHLVASGADIKVMDTPHIKAFLHLAILGGSMRRIRMIASLGKEFVLNTATLNELLQTACYYRYKEGIEAFLKLGADVNALGPEGYTAVHLASRNGHKSVVSTLLTREADINTMDKFGITPLHEASLNGNAEIAEMLLRNGADIEAKENEGRTPLHLASLLRHKETVRLLLDEGCNSESTDFHGQTPLHLASQWEVAELLIENGANAESTDNQGHTPLYLASLRGHRGVAEVLIENGAGVGTTDNHGQTPLHLASWKGHKEVAELLIENGASIESVTEKGWKPLTLASHHQHHELVALLLETGVNNAFRED